MINNNLQLSLLMMTLFIAAMASAEASTVSAAQVDGALYSLPKSDALGLQAANINLSQDKINQLANKTLSLKPGKAGFQGLRTTLAHCKNFHSKHVNIPHLFHPMFVIGDDAASLAWLKKYKPTLEKVGAIGLIVQMKNISELKQIIAAAGNLSLYPANGNELGKMFSVPCYPVLISKHLIEH